jgi:hypothetical protein
VTLLPTSKEIADKIQKEAKELYGFSLEEKSRENTEWMIKHGYLKKKRIRYGKPGRPYKTKK